MSSAWRWSVVAALLLAVPACSDEDRPVPAVTEARGADPFCHAWTEAMASGDRNAVDDLLADVPPALEDAAATVRAAGGSTTGAAEAAVGDILDWTELHCRSGGPGASQRRIAPPLDADVGLALCGTTAPSPGADEGRAGMALYGDAAAEDPYDGPMLGVLWTPGGSGGHEGDGDAVPVTVRGRSGVAAPITVFQQVVRPDLGTVVAWREGDLEVGLYGRRWPQDRSDELVGIADRLEAVDGGFRIPQDALPDGNREVFTGGLAGAALVPQPAPLYSVRYQGPDGLLDVQGLQLTDEEFDVFRFLTVDVDQGEVSGRPVLVGTAWGADGPSVVTWREPDGLVVRIVGIGVPLDIARRVAVEARELNAAEWAAIVEAEDTCHDQ